MYKVLKEIVETVSTGSKGETTVSVGGRVRSGEMKALIAKQLGSSMASLESQGQLDLKTGAIKAKKPKKEKSAEKLALEEVKKMEAKFPNTILLTVFYCLFKFTSSYCGFSR